MAQLIRPGVQSDVAPAGASQGASPSQAAADRLMKAAQAAYDRYPRDCSHLVNMVLRAVVNPSEPYQTANSLMASVRAKGSNWRNVSMQEASALANQGKVVIAGLAEAGSHGHVLVLVPGPMQADGGFSCHGQPIIAHGAYPPAVSGSLSGWPGAMSRGEKTARDAWRADQWPKVTFWVRQ